MLIEAISVALHRRVQTIWGFDQSVQTKRIFCFVSPAFVRTGFGNFARATLFGAQSAFLQHQQHDVKQQLPLDCIFTVFVRCHSSQSRAVGRKVTDGRYYSPF